MWIWTGLKWYIKLPEVACLNRKRGIKQWILENPVFAQTEASTIPRYPTEKSRKLKKYIMNPIVWSSMVSQRCLECTTGADYLVGAVSSTSFNKFPVVKSWVFAGAPNDGGESPCRHFLRWSVWWILIIFSAWNSLTFGLIYTILLFLSCFLYALQLTWMMPFASRFFIRHPGTSSAALRGWRLPGFSSRPRNWCKCGRRKPGVGHRGCCCEHSVLRIL